jgi:hypothetical protein
VASDIRHDTMSPPNIADDWRAADVLAERNLTTWNAANYCTQVVRATF